MTDIPPEPVEQESQESPESEEPGFDFAAPDPEAGLDYARMGAGVLIGLAIVGIVLFSLTDLSSVLVPMEEEYLSVLTPRAEDDSEFPFVLNQLINELEGNTLSVSGVMTNNSTEAVQNVLAVIGVEETTGRFPATLEVPLDPVLLEPGDSGIFSAAVTLRQRPNSYKIQFKLQNGPLVPHRDERGFGLESTFPPGNTTPTIRLTPN